MMGKKQVARLAEARKLIDQAAQIICDVKNERKGKDANDDYFALGTIEYDASQLSESMDIDWRNGK